MNDYVNAVLTLIFCATLIFAIIFTNEGGKKK